MRLHSQGRGNLRLKDTRPTFIGVSQLLLGFPNINQDFLKKIKIHQLFLVFHRFNRIYPTSKSISPLLISRPQLFLLFPYYFPSTTHVPARFRDGAFSSHHRQQRNWCLYNSNGINNNNNNSSSSSSSTSSNNNNNGQSLQHLRNFYQ